MIEKIEYIDRTEWRLNGKLHHEDGPAVEYKDGEKYWYLNGKRHREDGPAIEYANGAANFWYINSELHREDGPAIERFNGSKEWWVNGLPHREDGPAVECPDGNKYWYINGCCITNIKLYLNKRFKNCIGQFLYNNDKKYLILCFERENYYFYTVLWRFSYTEGKRYDCILEELRSVL